MEGHRFQNDEEEISDEERFEMWIEELLGGRDGEVALNRSFGRLELSVDDLR